MITDKRTRRYLLLLLLVILACTTSERLLLGIVLQDIKTDLRVSDTALGLLTGIAFSIFYSLVGIPISRWADRGDRVRIIAITTGLWGVTVALSGIVESFPQLVLVRIGVAVGEAGCLPSALSLISDYFDRSERPRAIAIYLQGGALGIALGYFAGGWLNQFYGWRLSFIAIGALGLVLAPIVSHTLRDPRREIFEADEKATFIGSEVARTGAGQSSLSRRSARDVWKILLGNATFRNLLLYYLLAAFFNIGIVQWQPAFFVRSFGMRTGELGTWIALLGGLGAMCGTYLGGEWVTRYASNDEKLQLRIMTMAYMALGVVCTVIYVTRNIYWAFGLMGLWNVLGTATSSPLLSLIQVLVPNRLRATAVAIIYLLANLIGIGLGPLAVGVISDRLQPWSGQESLRYTLLMFCPGYLWAGWHLWRASRTVTRDLRDVDLKEAGSPHSDEAEPQKC